MAIPGVEGGEGDRCFIQTYLMESGSEVYFRKLLCLEELVLEYHQLLEGG